MLTSTSLEDSTPDRTPHVIAAEDISGAAVYAVQAPIHLDEPSVPNPDQRAPGDDQWMLDAANQIGALLERSLTQWQVARYSERGVAEALALVDEIPSQATMRGLVAHEQAWRRLAETWGAWSSAEVAAVVGNTDSDVEEWAAAEAQRGNLLAVQRATRRVYPGYQFHPRTGEPSPAMSEILKEFRSAHWDDDSIALWFTSPQGASDGAVPAEILHVEPGRVLRAAKVTSRG